MHSVDISQNVDLGLIAPLGAHYTYLRNNCIRLPAIRCEFGKLNAKYQMHFRLRELANPSNPPLYPNISIDNDVTSRSLTGFSKHIKSKFLSGYSLHCDIGECYACNNS